MEISSHALALHRVDGLVVDVAAFTNLSRDHLDLHGSMEEYFAAKASLFTPERARRGVVCVDDAWGARLAGLSGVPVTTVATRPGLQADWRVIDEGVAAGLPQARVAGPAGRELWLRSPLPGRFNLANALVALAVLVEAGSDAEAAAAALAVAGPVPGRMERVGEPDAPPGAPLAVVDFAHSPDAVEQALAALAGSAAPGRPLVVVLGAGGDRDREKRPLMGAAAASAADVVVVTDDNPRSEDPAAVRAAVRAGAHQAARRSGAVVLEVAGRRAAIAEAVRRAWPGGVVLLAGKGHEQGQEIAGVVHPFDDRSALRAALDEVAAARIEQTGETEQTERPSRPSRRASDDPRVAGGGGRGHRRATGRRCRTGPDDHRARGRRQPPGGTRGALRGAPRRADGRPRPRGGRRRRRRRRGAGRARARRALRRRPC